MLDQARENLAEDNWLAAAEGILTTDTRPKLASRQIQLGEQTVTLTGMAKGAGMLRPNMATMLAYVATDATISQKRRSTPPRPRQSRHSDVKKTRVWFLRI